MIRVFGSLNMDLVASVDHIPVPGETVLTDDYLRVPGGKGNNQAVAAARAGAAVAMAGCLGQDGFAEILTSNLQRDGIDTRAVRAVDRPTGIAMITVDKDGENSITVASGANMAVTPDLIPTNDWTSSDILVVQMEVPPDATWAVVRQAHAAGARTIVNVAPAAAVPKDILKAIDILVVNEGEAMTVARSLGLTSPDIAATARALVQSGAGACVVTLGGDGAMAAAGDDEFRVPPARVSVVDTTGAGDTFTGVLAQGLDAGLSLMDALRRASMAAGLACEGLGAQASMPSGASIDAALDQGRI